ncbi:MAG: hypothetical protein WDZ90_02970, partial [Candidatus Paceibacterota bacterium]
MKERIERENQIDKSIADTSGNISKEDGIRKYYWTIGIVSALLLVVLGGIYIYLFTMPTSNSEFQEKVQRGGDVWHNQGTAEAVVYFQSLVEEADTPRQEGQAKLNLGVAL